MSEGSAPTIHGSYLLPHFEHATVGDAMHPGVLSCDAEATLTDIARMMSTHHVHCIVVDHAARGEGDVSSAWGIISDLDLLRECLRPDVPDTVSDFALQAAIRVETTMALRDAAKLMLSNGVSHVVAANPETQQPVGVVSTLDIAGVLAWGEM